MCQNSEIISMFVSPFIFPRKKPNGFECPFEANGCTVDFVELFSTVPHISNTDVPSCIFHIFFLAGVYAIIYCLCVSMLDAFVLHPKLIQNDEITWIVSIEKRRQNPSAFTRTNHTGENIPTEMATGYYREFMKTTFRSESTLNIHSETFFSRSTAQQTNPLGNKSLASVFMCSVSSIFICVLFVSFFFLSRPF